MSETQEFVSVKEKEFWEKKIFRTYYKWSDFEFRFKIYGRIKSKRIKCKNRCDL